MKSIIFTDHSTRDMDSLSQSKKLTSASRLACHLALYQKRVCMVMITILIAFLLPMKKTTKTQHLQTKRQQLCKGHFHLCMMKQLIAGSHLYGKLGLPHSIYNVSHLVNFKTEFFKHRKQGTINFLENHEKMSRLRLFLMNEHKNKQLNRNLRNDLLDKKQSALMCSFKPFEHFKYKCSYLKQFECSPPKLLFAVMERRLDTLLPQKGMRYGPSSVSDVHGDVLSNMTRTVCNVTDFYEGTYYIECPVLENKFTIRMYVSYGPSSIYRYRCKYEDEFLIKEFKDTDLPQVEAWKPGSHLYHLHTPQCSSHVSPQGFAFWVNLGGVWHWSTMICHYSFRFGAKVRHCLRKKNVTMIGDSHMRNRHLSLRKHEILNGTFIFTCVVSELQAAMTREHFSPGSVLILNSGHWSLTFVDIATYMSDMKELLTYLQSLKMLRDTSTRIIWLEMPARPFKEWHPRWLTNLIMVALNDWTNNLMRSIGVEVVPAFQISFPMRSKTIDGFHFHELLEEDVFHHNNLVSVGGAIDTVLLHTICPA